MEIIEFVHILEKVNCHVAGFCNAAFSEEEKMSENASFNIVLLKIDSTWSCGHNPNIPNFSSSNRILFPLQR